MIIVRKAFAKINLSIDVLSKREDNYHELDMILQSVNLYDLIQIEKNDSGKIILSSNDKTLPLDIKNDAYKAAFLMKEHFSIDSGYNIHIEKTIPIEAGLGGGSSDAASVINSICAIEGISVSDEKLFKIGLKIGAELPYSIKSGLARVRGMGEKIERIDARHNLVFTIVKPEVSLSTKEIFSRYRLEDKKEFYTENLALALKNSSFKDALSHMGNDLEKASFLIHPELEVIKNDFIKLGALSSLMSGSGTSVYGVFLTMEDAINAEQYFKEKNMRAFALSPVYA